MSEGRTAVVTGGSRGIGRAIVERLCRDGAQVVFTYAANEGAAMDVVRAVRADGGEAHALRAEFLDPAEPEQVMEVARARLGGLDILVNNAALPHDPAPLAETGTDLFDQVMTVNARSVFLTVRYAARWMRDGGRIVNISTLNTVRPTAGIGAYAASKGAVEQLTVIAARELGPRGITVNTVSPGATDTEQLRSVNSSEALEAVAGLTPLGRLGQPADVADVVAFLVGQDGRWITGQNLRAAGGLV
ncbi:SDR family oxidoreductase [Streptomyces sp. NPDC048664]|uniref:SDR family oxidoreductase n=1 Tax=Streptomyces sp. NPDC048664 TaxID=3154505 RepID=UPI00343E3144